VLLTRPFRSLLTLLSLAGAAALAAPGGPPPQRTDDAQRGTAPQEGTPKPPAPPAALAPGAAAQPLPPPSLAQPRGPQLSWFEAAPYPIQRLFAGLEAEVPCELGVDERGAVSDVACEEGSDALFARAAEKAIARWRFQPATLGGVPRRARLQITYRFAQALARLPEAETPPEAIEVTGEVLRQGVASGVAGAEVIAQGLGIGATCDARGRFTLRLPPGQHVLTAAALTFEPEQGKVLAEPGGHPSVTLFLRPKDVLAMTATVTGEKERRAAVKQTLVREELRNVPGSQGDPLRVIEALPGLARVPFTGGQLIVRGASAQDTGAYIDGQRIPQLYHLLNGPSVLGEEMVEKLDFYPGGAGAYFGRSLAGVVQVQSRRGDAERFHGSLTTDLQKTAVFLQGPIGEGTTFSVGGRRSYVNPAVEFFADARKSYTVPVYWDYQLRVDHKLDATSLLQLTAYGSNDSYEQVGTAQGVSSTMGRQLGFHRARLAWQKGLGENLQLTVAPMFGWDSSQDDVSGAGPGVFERPQHHEEHTLSLGGRAELAWHTGALADVRAGLDLQFDRVSYQLDQLFDQQLRGLGAPNAEERQLSGLTHFGSIAEYAESELRLGPLRVTPGLRFEQLHYGQQTFALFDPRLWARLPVAAQTALFAYAGVYHQAPTAEQLDAQIGNPSLLPLRADQYGAGVEQRFGELWSVKLEGFLNRRRSLVFPAKATAYGCSADYTGCRYANPLELNSGQGHSFGLELLLRRELDSRFYGWISYSLSKSRELQQDGTLWQPTPFDQPHVLTLLLGVRVSPFIELAARLRVASGNPIAPVVGAVFDSDAGTYTPTTLPFGSARLPTFVQLDLQLNNVWLTDRFHLSLYVDFQNITGRDNYEVQLYDYRYQATDYVHGLPFQALVGAKAAF
jgi:TonB family protein